MEKEEFEEEELEEEDEEVAEKVAGKETELSADDDDDGEGDASLEDLMAKQSPDDDDPEAIFELRREDKPRTLTVRTVPRKANEFVCSSCHLVKHHSQLADRRRKLCLDCI